VYASSKLQKMNLISSISKCNFYLGLRDLMEVREITETQSLPSSSLVEFPLTPTSQWLPH